MARKNKGCKTRPSHLEDTRHTQLMKQFPTEEELARRLPQQQQQQQQVPQYTNTANAHNQNDKMVEKCQNQNGAQDPYLALAPEPMQPRSQNTSSLILSTSEYYDALAPPSVPCDSRGVHRLPTYESPVRAADRVLEENASGKMVWIEHRVLPSDTLDGISLFYGTTKAALMKKNRLYASKDLNARKYLLVPRSNPKQSTR